MKFQMAMRTRAIPVGQYAETLDAGIGGGKCQGNSPLKMAMMNEAMAEMTELIAPAMAEMMFPMVAGGRLCVVVVVF